MAMNPMQRKANNYLLIGVLVTLLITGSIIAILFMQLNKLQKEQKEQESSMKKVSVLSKDITSGQAVTESDFKTIKVSSSAIPSNAIDLSSITEKTIAKINLKAKSIVTSDMIQESDAKLTKDLRKQEYNMVILPSQIKSGDYIDIRLRLSNGVDYIVVSKKSVEIPTIDGVDSASSININMTEDEIMVMSNAIIEAYIDKGSLLYATTYVEPGMQETVIPTYVPDGTVQSALNSNPNIEQEAKNALFTRYNQNGTTRDIITRATNQYAQERVDNIEAGVQEQITKAKEERQSYLESLGGY